MRLPATLVLATLCAACASQSPHPATAPATTRQASTTQGSSPQVITSDLRDVLSMLARAHSQKTQLAFYVSTPLRTVDPPFKAFFKDMGDVQGDLLKQLKRWASARHVDLTFHFSNDIEGRAQKFMEDQQSKVARSDNKLDFQRDMLMNMYTDYQWQISLLTETLPLATDIDLRTYLENSLHAHEAGSRQIRGLLAKYNFVP